MSQLEGKCQEMTQEILELKRENHVLRETEKALLKKLDHSETSRQELLIKCNEFKQDNRNLKENLREVIYLITCQPLGG